MDYAAFTTIAKRARTERTEAAALELLAAYADSGCATYPVDSKLIREVWPNGKPPGFSLFTYHLEGSDLVIRA